MQLVYMVICSYLCILYCSVTYITGSVRRRCIIDDLWEEFIECFREETRILFDQVIITVRT